MRCSLTHSTLFLFARQFPDPRNAAAHNSDTLASIHPPLQRVEPYGIDHGYSSKLLATELMAQNGLTIGELQPKVDVARLFLLRFPPIVLEIDRGVAAYLLQI